MLYIEFYLPLQALSGRHLTSLLISFQGTWYDLWASTFYLVSEGVEWGAQWQPSELLLLVLYRGVFWEWGLNEFDESGFCGSETESVS